MTKPAARISDTCPIAGTIVKGFPTVLVGSKPAARIGDSVQCLYVLPGVVSSGSTSVLIGSQPASRMSDEMICPLCIVSGSHKVTGGEPTVLIGDAGAVSTGLGPEVDQMMRLSPTLLAKVKKLKDEGWTLEYGTAGKGTFTDKTHKKIVIDSNDKGDTTAILNSLAHETGHATYDVPWHPPKGLTRQQYVERNTRENLRDEGEATLSEYEVRDELLAAGGPDIGISGGNRKAKDKAYADYKKHGDRARARDDIGQIFHDKEHPSNDTSKTYYDYYKGPHEKWWDKNITPNPDGTAPQPAGPQAAPSAPSHEGDGD